MVNDKSDRKYLTHTSGFAQLRTLGPTRVADILVEDETASCLKKEWKKRNKNTDFIQQ